jgi:hypothetical protein
MSSFACQPLYQRLLQLNPVTLYMLAEPERAIPVGTMPANAMTMGMMSGF